MYVFKMYSIVLYRLEEIHALWGQNGASFAHPLHSSGRPVSCALVIKFGVKLCYDPQIPTLTRYSGIVSISF
jgi:hypothetical protein